MSEETMKQIFEEVLQDYNKNKEKKISTSFSHCHFKNVYSVWLTDTIRCFFTEEDIEGVSQFDIKKPHEHNDKFLIHDHRHDLTSIPLSGQQINIKYSTVNKMEEQCEVYKAYKFYSGILNEDLKPKYEYIQDVILKATEISRKSWYMKKEEIHRVFWKGPVIALLKEHRDDNQISKDATNGYLISSADKFPCKEGLYQPISVEKYTEIVKNVILIINMKIK
eukprot:gene8415-240_t